MAWKETTTPREQRIGEAFRRVLAAGRLRWLIDFCQRDLGQAPPGAFSDLVDEVLAFAGARYHGLAEVSIAKADLVELQRKVLTGLRAVLQGGEWRLGHHDVEVVVGPDLERHPVEAQPQLPTKDVLQDGFVYRMWRPLGIRYVPRRATVASLFELASAHESVTAQGDIRSCPWCGKFYLPDFRQQRYCSKECTAQAVGLRKGRRKERPRAAIPELERFTDTTSVIRNVRATSLTSGIDSPGAALGQRHPSRSRRHRSR